MTHKIDHRSKLTLSQCPWEKWPQLSHRLKLRGPVQVLCIPASIIQGEGDCFLKLFLPSTSMQDLPLGIPSGKAEPTPDPCRDGKVSQEPKYGMCCSGNALHTMPRGRSLVSELGLV